jgi:hypothetical protein
MVGIADSKMAQYLVIVLDSYHWMNLPLESVSHQ